MQKTRPISERERERDTDLRPMKGGESWHRFAEAMTVTTGTKHQEIHIDSCSSEHTLLWCSDRSGVFAASPAWTYMLMYSQRRHGNTLRVFGTVTRLRRERQESTQTFNFLRTSRKPITAGDLIAHESSDRNGTLNDIIGEALTLTPPLARREAERSARCFGILTLV
ncbi:hypothetical protein F2P79_023240 [Pimephales promelas]|nr:hypothetical protein F2P79_023240 [Pimephales promelas]